MKFSELNKDAKEVAVNDYIKGWKETHPEETISVNEATDFCMDTDEYVNYDHNGKVKE